MSPSIFTYKMFASSSALVIPLLFYDSEVEVKGWPGLSLNYSCIIQASSEKVAELSRVLSINTKNVSQNAFGSSSNNASFS